MSRSSRVRLVGARLAMRSDGGDGPQADVLAAVDDPAGYDRAIRAHAIRKVLAVPRSAARRVTPGRAPSVGTSTLDLGDGTHLFGMWAKEGDERIIQFKAFMATPTIYTNMQQIMTHLGYQCCGAQRSRIGMN